MQNQPIALFTVEITSSLSGERVQRTFSSADRAAAFFQERDALGQSPAYVETPATTRAHLDRLAVRK